MIQAISASNYPIASALAKLELIETIRNPVVTQLLYTTSRFANNLEANLDEAEQPLKLKRLQIFKFLLYEQEWQEWSWTRKTRS